MCSGAMLHARVDRLVFGAVDPRTGVAGSVLNLFEQPQLNHQTQVTGGVLAEACGQLLKDFFKPRRINAEPLREDALRTPDAAFVGLPEWALSRWWSDLPCAPGLRVHAHDTGPDNATEATLWVHGAGGWSLGWRDAVVAALQARPGRHIVPDLPGFGRSDKPKKEAFHQISTHAYCLHALCQRLGLTQVQLVGAPDVQGLMQTLRALAPDTYTVSAVQTPTALPAAWRDAPYPDKGYRAGPRALARSV